MLSAMRRLALDSLYFELGEGTDDSPEAWYRELRENDAAKLFPKLVEKSERIERVYVLSADPRDADTAVLEVRDFLPETDPLRLPFNQPSGSQSAALGPVIKRTWSATKKAPGPSRKIQNTTLGSFQAIAAQGRPWSPYFEEAASVFSRKKLRSPAGLIEAENSFAAAVGAIDERTTVFLTFRDSSGRYPGDRPEYQAYLQEVLAETKYAAATSPVSDKTCSLCGAHPTTVYPNALRGAKLNLANLDREGAFPGVSGDNAWKGFAICPACADLLYVYKNYVSGEFLLSVAGERALVIPFTQLDLQERRRFISRVREIPSGTEKQRLANIEDRLMNLLADQRVVTSVTFLWADFGNAIENVRGVVPDVLPSRLRRIEQLNLKVGRLASPHFPQRELEDFRYDLRLSVLNPILRRPGGKKAKSVNQSKRLFDLRRELVAAIYHGHQVDETQFWREAFLTARCYVNEAAANRDSYGLLYEGFSEKKGVAFLTFAGWLHQLAKFLYYLQQTGVFVPMSETTYVPECESLKPYFGRESGIDGPQKAFAFILGALFGKVMQVQAARGVNVGANALTWLKRLTLRGSDLPELYVKVREKLLSYETEHSPRVRGVVEELGRLGQQIGSDIELDDVTTCYFLLLGQSLATTIMPGKSPREEKGE